MSAKEIVFLICLAFAIFLIWQLLHIEKIKKKRQAKKKAKQEKAEKKKAKKDKKQKDPKTEEKETKIEPAMKKQENPKEEKKEEQKQPEEKEKTLEKQPEEKDKKLHVIRRKSELKINKKAVSVQGRDPSISRVFDKNGKNLIEEEKKQKEQKQEVKVEEKKEKKPVERFGTREYEYSEQNTSTFFQINAPKGSPLRAPTIGDRTNFTERLRVSEDGNLSGVSGIGLHGAVKNANSQARVIEEKNQEMLERVDQSLRNPEFGEALFQYSSFGEPREKKSKGQTIVEKLDAETLIIADAINNPRHKKPHSSKN